MPFGTAVYSGAGWIKVQLKDPSDLSRFLAHTSTILTTLVASINVDLFCILYPYQSPKRTTGVWKTKNSSSVSWNYMSSSA